MYFAIAALFVAFAALFYVPDFLDIPIGVLTFRQLMSELLCTFFGLIAFAALAKSIEFDSLWPWREGLCRTIAALRRGRRP